MTDTNTCMYEIALKGYAHCIKIDCERALDLLLVHNPPDAITARKYFELCLTKNQHLCTKFANFIDKQTSIDIFAKYFRVYELSNIDTIYTCLKQHICLDDKIILAHYPIIVACEDANLSMMQWLYARGVDMSVNNNQIFTICYRHGRLDILKWLLEIIPGFDLSSNNCEAFHTSLANRHYDVACYLYELYGNQCLDQNIIIAKLKYYYDFDGRFNRGSITNEFVELVCKIKSDNYKFKQQLFLDNCSDGNTIAVQKILTHGLCENTTDDIYVELIIKGFNFACKLNRLDVAKLLYKKSDADLIKSKIRDDNDILFKYCCSRNCVEIIVWLVSLYPNWYSVAIMLDKDRRSILGTINQ